MQAPTVDYEHVILFLLRCVLDRNRADVISFYYVGITVFGGWGGGGI